MPASYASFRIDPSINFDNFNLGWDDNVSSPTISNFSRPISFRPALSPNHSQHSFALSDSSKRSSFISTKGPMTPKLGTPIRESFSKPRIATPDDDPVTSSFLMDSRSPKLDLSFAVESVMRTYQPLSTPSSPVMRSTTPSGKARPLTAIKLDPAPSLTSKPCPIHGARKSMSVPKPPCPVHGVRQPTSALSGAPSYPDSRKSIGDGPAAPSHSDSRKSMADRPPVPSYLDSRKSVGDRPAILPTTDSTKSLPTLPFLKLDPFAPQVKDPDRVRPRSAGVGATTSGSGTEDFPPKKQSAPSIMSTRSTRSIRKGFSRVRRLLSRTN